MFIGCRDDTVARVDLILLLDNKDSFVWNLAQALRKLGAEVDVVRSDRTDVEDVARYRGAVLSPGPGRPEHAGRCLAPNPNPGPLTTTQTQTQTTTHTQTQILTLSP